MTIRRRTARLLLLLLTVLLLSTASLLTVQAQPASPHEAEEAPEDTLSYALDSVVVYATPFALTTETAPFAVSTLTRSDVELSGNPALSLEGLTYAIPGLWVNGRTHYALGDRITMRGLGWRAQFGVRGVQVLLDGIPLTMADGQSILGVVDPAFIRRIEVIRGPASTFWGNSSGGVLYLSTRPATGGRASRSSSTDANVGRCSPPYFITCFLKWRYLLPCQSWFYKLSMVG